MEYEKINLPAICVIGKVGSTNDGEGFVQKLWKEANSHFDEVSHLAMKNPDGSLVGFWGAMTNFNFEFKPWEDNFTKGLYMAGVEVASEARAPKGWKKWIIPGFEGLKVKVTGPDTFSKMIDYMKEQKIELVGAVQDFTDPKTQTAYMIFPTAWNDSKDKLIQEAKVKVDPIAPCGFYCSHCFMTAWCGNCRSPLNMCSFATMSEDNRCAQELCCSEKGFDGCWECSELETCNKGFFATQSGHLCKAYAIYIKKHGKKAYIQKLEECRANKVNLDSAKTTDEALKMLEE